MANDKKPNILVIWGDDIGISNLSCYSHGVMGYRTPNIDRIAKEGMLFTDSYGEQSCTAGRSSFITGQSVFRTGLSKVGLPGAPVGMNETSTYGAAIAFRKSSPPIGSAGKNLSVDSPFSSAASSVPPARPSQRRSWRTSGGRRRAGGRSVTPTRSA